MTTVIYLVYISDRDQWQMHKIEKLCIENKYITNVNVE